MSFEERDRNHGTLTLNPSYGLSHRPTSREVPRKGTLVRVLGEAVCKCGKGGYREENISLPRLPCPYLCTEEKSFPASAEMH